MLRVSEALQGYSNKDLKTLGGNWGIWPRDKKAELSREQMLQQLAEATTKRLDWPRIANDFTYETATLILAILAWPTAMLPEPDEAILATASLCGKAKPNAYPNAEALDKTIDESAEILHNIGVIYHTIRRKERQRYQPEYDAAIGPTGALHRRAVYSGAWLHDGVIIPIEVAARVFAHLHTDIKENLYVYGEPTRIRNDGFAALYDIVQLACTIKHPGLRLTQKGPLYKKDRDLLESHLLVKESLTIFHGFIPPAGDQTPLRTQFILAWAAALQIIFADIGNVAIGSAAEQWMQLAPADQLLSLLEVWLKYVAPTEPGIPFIIATLLSADRTRWLDLSAILTILYRTQHTIVKAVHTWQPYGMSAGGIRMALAALVYMGLLELGSKPEAAEKKPGKAQGKVSPGVSAATTATVTEADPMWLLLNQLHLEPGTLYVRLTETGYSALLHNRIDDQFPLATTLDDQQPFIVQPNYEVMVRPFSAPGLHWSLSQIAELTRPDQAYLYRITKDSIIRALRSGWTTESILSFLRVGRIDATDAVPTKVHNKPAIPLPQNVEYSISTWGSGYGRCTVMRIAIVQCENEALAQQLLTENTLQDLVIGQASPTALIVRDDALKKVFSLLEKAGLPPPAEPVYVTDSDVAKQYNMGLPDFAFIGPKQ